MPERKDRKIECKIAISFILVIVFLIHFPENLVASSLRSEWYTHFISQFFHANAFHLVSNIIVMWMISFSTKELIASFIISVFSTYAGLESSIGFSSVIYALLGMKALHINLGKKDWIMFLTVNLATAFIPSISFSVHAVSFISGMIFDLMKKLINDYRRACKRR